MNYCCWGYSSAGREKIEMSCGHFYDERRSFVNELGKRSNCNEFTKQVTEATNGSKKRLNGAVILKVLGL